MNAKFYRRIPFFIPLVFFLGCNEEKAVAIKTMSNQLVESVRQIEERLDVYWGHFRPQTDIMDTHAQIKNLATHLVSNREKILKKEDGFADQDLRDQILMAVEAIDEIQESQGKTPYDAALRSIKQRTLAIRDAVEDIDKGHFFAGKAVESLGGHVRTLAQDLLKLHKIVEEAGEQVDQVNREEKADFDTSVEVIRREIKKGSPTVDQFMLVIQAEFEKGFKSRGLRKVSRDELLARIATTAAVATRLADSAKSYRRLDWEVIAGEMRDMAHLASSADMPVRYQLVRGQAVDSVNRFLKKHSVPEIPQPATAR